jgi:hypothetical protein
MVLQGFGPTVNKVAGKLTYELRQPRLVVGCIIARVLNLPGNGIGWLSQSIGVQNSELRTDM